MVEDRLQVLDIDVSVETSARIKSPFKGADSQRISVCHNNRVIAVANGRFVDLYGVSTNSLHPFTFLHQISISDHVTRQHSSYLSDDNSPDLKSVVATCVVFSIPGFLLVGALLDVPESETTSTMNPVFLLGFRLYAGSVTQFTSLTNTEKPREATSSIQVYFSFMEPIVGFGGKSIRCFQSFRHDMTPDAGSVLVLFENSKIFGVFSWKERFSDRQVCLAQIKQHSDSLIIAECGENGRYVVLGDTKGRLSLLDFKDFSRAGGELSSNTQQIVGKRLESRACSRAGVVARDNPLERVRVAYTLASGMECAYTSLRWWECGVRDQRKKFFLAGKQDGSLNILKLVQANDEANSTVELRLVQMYPGLASGTHDAVRSISEPVKFAESNSTDDAGFEFSVISEMRWRTWRIKVAEVGEESSKRYRMIWPPVRDSLDFPSFPMQTMAVRGIVLLPRSSELSRVVAEALADSMPGHTPRYPVAFTIAANRLQVAGLLTKTAIESTEAFSDSGSDAEYKVDDNKTRCEEAQEEETIIEQRRSEERHPSGPTTIQDKYKLPPMEWKTRNSTSVDGNLRERPKGSGQEGVATSKLSRVDYNERVTSVMQRVETLSGVMKSMRTSFQLFSSDVQHHMNLISDQLEEINRRRVTRETAGSSE